MGHFGGGRGGGQGMRGISYLPHLDIGVELVLYNLNWEGSPAYLNMRVGGGGVVQAGSSTLSTDQHG